MKCSAVPWGAYRMVKAVGKLGAVATERLYMVGSSPGQPFTNAVVVGDESQPLVVSGHVHITGDIVCGPQAVVRGRYQGESAPEESFHDGDVSIEAVVSLPQIDTGLVSHYLDDMSSRLAHADLLIGTTHICDHSDKAIPQTYNNLIAASDLVLDGVHWSSTEHVFSVGARADLDIEGNSTVDGMVEFSCDQTIRVSDSAFVSLAVLWARDSIIIEDDAIFSGIAMSPGIIVVRDEARLRYPALLLSYNSDNAPDTTPVIQVRSHQVCEGSIVSLLTTSNPSDIANTIYLDTSSVLVGCILSSSQVDVRGTVWGSIVTERFLFAQPPATYTNWIRNAWIDRTRLQHVPEVPMLADSGVIARVVAVRDVNR